MAVVQMYQKQPDGSVSAVEVPEDQVAQARAAGLGFRNDQKINLVDTETGEVYEATPDQFDQAMRAGSFRIETGAEQERRAMEREYGTTGEVIKTFGENALSSATLGLSDVALGAIGGDDYRKARAARDTVNETAATLGSVTGAIAPLVVSGGSSLAARGVAAVGTPTRLASAAGRAAEGLAGSQMARLGITGESLLGRAALQGTRLGVGGAVEGALQGAGEALSEVALAPNGNYDELGEKLLAGAKNGALLGGLLGGGLGVVAGGASKAFDNLTAKKDFKESLEAFAAERTAKAIGFRGSTLKQLGRTTEEAQANLKALYQDIINHHLDDGTKVFRAGDKAEDLFEKLAAAKEEVGAKLGQLRKDVDAFTRAREDLLPDSNVIMDRIKADVLDPLKLSSVADVRALARKVEKNLTAFDPKAYYKGTNELVPEGKIGHTAAATVEAGSTQSTQSWREFLKGKMGPAMSKHGGDHTAAIRELSADYKAMKAAGGQQAAEQVIPAREIEYRRPTMTLDQLTQLRKDLDAVIYPTPVRAGQLTQAPAGAEQLLNARRIIEQEIEAATERAVKEMSPEAAGNYARLKRQYKSFKTASDVAGGAELQDLGNRVQSPSDYGVGLAVAVGDIASGGGYSLATIAKQQAAAMGHKFVRERGSSALAVWATKLANLDSATNRAIKQTLKKTEQAARSAATKAIVVSSGEKENKTDAALGKKKNETRAQAYYRTLDDVEKTYATAQTIGTAEAPNISAAAQATAIRAADFLKSKAPKQPKAPNGTLLPPKKVEPNAVEIQKYARYVQVVKKPYSVLDELEAGTLTREHIEALKTVYPSIYAGLKTKVLEQVHEIQSTNEPIETAKLRKLSILFEAPLTRDMRPESIALSQSIYAPAQEQGGQQAAAPARRKAGAPNIAKSYESRAQQLESGDLDG